MSGCFQETDSLMKTPIIVLLGVVIGFSGETFAQVVINEIGAAGSDRLLRSQPNGPPRLGWGPSWRDVDYDDDAWALGDAPFGFGVEGVATDLGEAMRGRTPSVYLRKTFQVSPDEAQSEEPLILTARVDNGFVAHINGHEIARANLGARNGFVFHLQSTFSDAQANEEVVYNSGLLARDVLKPGENFFAVQVQNRVPAQINERDQSIDETLFFISSLTLGDSGSPIDIDSSAWRYRVGYAEPCGGVVDWAQVAHPDVEGGFSDWVELYNQGDEPVNLTGWHLTDDEETPNKWHFPDGTTIAGNGYLLVLADRETEVPGDFLHANFALSADGEFLGLSNDEGVYVSQFEEGYPQQNPFRSYGLSVSEGNSYVYFEQPSPGSENVGFQRQGIVETPTLSIQGGVYDNSVNLTLQTETEGAEIRYTRDGSEPNQIQGMLYEGPIAIERIDDRTGTPVRARAFKEGMVPSRERTQTYLVGVDEAFKTVSTLSLVAEPGDAFFKPHGILSIEGRNVPKAVSEYYMPAMHGRAFERQVSVEWILPHTNTNLHLQGGLRLSASAFSRRDFSLTRTDESPWPSEPPHKPSFNLFLRGDYGESRLDYPLVEDYPVSRFRQFRLRAGKNDIVNPWITDEMARRVFTDTGQFGAVGTQNALFINGSYKGYYNSVGRLREELFQEWAGNENPWQVKHIDVWADGSPLDNKLADTPEWDHVEMLLNQDLRELENYEALIAELDPVNFADYFIVNLYGATLDWPHNNLVIARELSEMGRWRAYMWDAEGIFGVQSSHTLMHDSIVSELQNGLTSPSDDLATVWRGLIRSPEWRLLFADRLQKHFFTPGGALTQENLTDRLSELAEQMTPLMAFSGQTMDPSEITEWIDGRQEVLFGSDDYWEPHGLWGEAAIPNIDPHGGDLNEGSKIKLVLDPVPNRASIYYTADGSDPRQLGGELHPEAILYDLEADPGITIEGIMTVKARVRIQTVFKSTWGALNEATFRTGIVRASSDNFLISEFLPDPQGPNATEGAAGFTAGDFEYIEFFNPTDFTVDLAGLTFSDGIDYEFGDATLGPQSYGLIVRNADAFAMRYGEALPVFGEYDRGLSNSGERLMVMSQEADEILSIEYQDEAPWPESLREGHSLVRKDFSANAEPNDPTSWVASEEVGGTPGKGTSGILTIKEAYAIWLTAQFSPDEFSNELLSGPGADPDEDGSNNLSEFAFGSLPKDRRSQPKISIGSPLATFSFSRREGFAASYGIETSINLRDWKGLSADDVEEIKSELLQEGLQWVTVQIDPQVIPDPGFLRVRVEMSEP